MLFSLRQNIISATLAILGALSLSIMLSLSKLLHPGISTIFVVFVKTCFGLMFFVPILLSNRKTIAKTDMLPLHILRIILSIGAILCTYYAYRNLPVAYATSIGMSGSLFTTILSVIVLKEKISFAKWLIIFLGYLGVIIVVRPVSFFLDLGTASALLANLLSSCIIILVKILLRYDSTATIMFYAIIGIIIITFLLNIHGWEVLTMKDLILLSFMGLLGVITQFCSFTALKYSNLSFVAPFEYTRVFFAILIGLIIFHEIPDVYTLFGSTLIILSVYMITCLDNETKNPAREK